MRRKSAQETSGVHVSASSADFFLCMFLSLAFYFFISVFFLLRLISFRFILSAYTHIHLLISTHTRARRVFMQHDIFKHGFICMVKALLK